MSLATISLSELAPDEACNFNLPSASFVLGGSGRKTYETNDPQAVSDASVHPYLEVKVHEVDEAVEKAAEEETPLVAIDANLKQTVPVNAGEVAETLAADDSSKTAKKKD